jgi:hypothetical protein
MRVGVAHVLFAALVAVAVREAKPLEIAAVSTSTGVRTIGKPLFDVVRP